MLKRILLSLTLISTISFSVFAFTQAFFSDAETSSGNVFQAGKVDLLIDNHSYYNGQISEETSWESDNLPGHYFFNFSDLKPSDWGEDTISIKVDDNDAWACMEASITSNDDGTCTEPELIDDNDCDPQNPNNQLGELGGLVEMVFWVDDGDNVLEANEATGSGLLSQGTAEEVLSNFQQTLADASENIFDSPDQWLDGGETYFIGKAWCFGEMVLVPEIQDGFGYLGEGANGPDVRTPGFTCDGSGLDNASQSDTLTGDFTFYAVQSRNNPNYSCDGTIPTPSPIPSPSPSQDPTPHDKFVDRINSVTGNFGAPVTLSSSLAEAMTRTVGVPDNSFIQISDSTVIEWEFTDNQAVNGSGDDIRIHVIDTLYPGSAKIEVSPNGSSWTDVGNHADTADVLINLGDFGLTSINFVRITDLYDPVDPYPNLGFDIDAIEAINSIPLP
jgi:hypothetical protein